MPNAVLESAERKRQPAGRVFTHCFSRVRPRRANDCQSTSRASIASAPTSLRFPLALWALTLQVRDPLEEFSGRRQVGHI